MAGTTVNNDEPIWLGYDVDNVDGSRKNPVNSLTRKPSNELDKDAFLKLLLTQMQYQDPLNPTDDKQFIAQMAQFTSLEQMQNVNKSVVQIQAYSMMGKYVEGSIINEEANTKTMVDGVVSAVRMQNGEAMLLVSIPGKDEPVELPLNRVENVYSDNFIGSINNLNSNIITQQNLALMGKFVQAVIPDKDGKPIKFIEGKVDNIKFDDRNNPILVVGNEEIYAKHVLSIGEKMRLIGEKIHYDAEVDGETKAVEGTISNIYFKDLNIKGEEPKIMMTVSGKDFEIKNIGVFTDSLKYVGQNVNYDSISGKVVGIKVKNGLPYMMVNTAAEGEDPNIKDLSYIGYKGITLS